MLSLYSCLFFGVFYYGSVVSGARNYEVVNPLKELDVMGSYRLDNRHQCQRLCWYWKACGRYSFYTKNDNSGDNCVLHGRRQKAQDLTDGWMDEEAQLPSDKTPAGGCSNRPCSLQEMCVPVYSTHTKFFCAPMNSSAWLGQSCSGTTCNSLAPANITGCFNAQCLCAAGYYYSESQRTCLASCGDRGNSYLCYEFYDLRGHDVKDFSAENLAQCKGQCASDSRCLVLVYSQQILRCYIKYVTALIHPENWGQKREAMTCQRTCA